MENRLMLNKRPKYELPDEVVIGLSNLNPNRYTIPNFEPDIAFNMWGTIKVREANENSNQIWVKTDNKELINFLKNYNWSVLEEKKITNAYSLALNKFKKIILEEFYNRKDL